MSRSGAMRRLITVVMAILIAGPAAAAPEDESPSIDDTDDRATAAGACCRVEGCVITTETRCAARDGYFLGLGTSCDDCDVQVGACCTPEKSCLSPFPVQLCLALGGVFQGLGTSCAGPQCIGACCRPDEPCILVTGAQCADLAGFYAGDTTLCTGCAGACCLTSGACQDGVTLDDCVDRGGTFQGAAPCADVACPVVLGACCLLDDSCIDALSFDACTTHPAFFSFEPGLSCADAKCFVTGACCLPDESCLLLGVSTCDTLGGFSAGAATVCADVACDPDNIAFACCFSDGSCAPSTKVACNVTGGAWQEFMTCGTVACPFVLDFSTEDDFVTELVNGQAIDETPSPVFGRLVTISGTGLNRGAAIFDSTPGANPHDPDLGVGQGNMLILQNRHFPEQAVPGVFDRPDDSAQGGTLRLDFATAVRPASLNLVDISGSGHERATVTLLNAAPDGAQSGNEPRRTFDVPSGWTSSNDGGVLSLRLDTLADQSGVAATVTATETRDFDANRVIAIEIDFHKSGAVDNVTFFTPAQ